MSELPLPKNWRWLSEEVIQCEDGVFRFDEIELLKKLARGIRRQRVRICLHSSAQSQTHEMIIVHARDTYVPPHWHEGKSESVYALEGTARHIVFDQSGGVVDVIRLSADPAQGMLARRIDSGVSHTLLIESDVFVFLEVTGGPFFARETRFPEWAPAIDDEAGQAELMKKLQEYARNVRCSQ